MKKKLYYIIGLFGFIKIMFDGFDGEFYNPTTYDFIKWNLFAVYLFLLFIYHRKGD